MYDVIIVGGGAAGMTAGIYAARSGMKAVMLEGWFAGGQASTTDMLYNYPGFPEGIGGPELMMKFEEQAQRMGLEIRYEQVGALELQGEVKRARVGDAVLEGKTVILSMGAARRKLNVPGEDELNGRGVSYCSTCDGALYRGKRVAVVGGGNSAVEDATYMARIGQVILIHRRDRLRAQGHDVQKLLDNPSVDFKLGYVIRLIEKSSSGLTLSIERVLDHRIEPLEVEGLFIAVGTDPNTRLVLGQVRLDELGYVEAGEDTRTSLPGVFAAGDIRQKPLKQVVTAVADGAVAASMAGQYINEH